MIYSGQYWDNMKTEREKMLAGEVYVWCKIMIRQAKTADIPRIIDLLHQVDMVHHRLRPDLFKPHTTKYSEQELQMPGAQSYQAWKFLVCYIAPAAVFLVFLNVVGVI